MMVDDKKTFKFAISAFDKLLLKLKKSKYAEDKNFFKLVNLLENTVIF